MHEDQGGDVHSAFASRSWGVFLEEGAPPGPAITFTCPLTLQHAPLTNATQIKIKDFRTMHKTDVIYGNRGSEPVSTLTWCFPANVEPGVAVLEVAPNRDGTLLPPMQGVLIPEETNAEEGLPDDARCQRLTLPAPLAPGEQTIVAAASIVVGQLEAYPASAPAGTPPLARLLDSAAFYSPYPVEYQTLKVDPPSPPRDLEAPGIRVVKSDKAVALWLNERDNQVSVLPPFTHKPFFVQFEAGSGFALGKSVDITYTIESSGEARVDEEYSLVRRRVAF